MDNKEYHKKYREENREKRRKWNNEWIAKNKERYNASKYIYREKTKLTVMKHYGNGKIECIKCGEKDIDVLCLDHIKNDGAEQRKKLGISGRNSAGMNTYEVLKREGYPDGLQILCANCNLKKEMQRKRELRLKNTFYSQRIESEVMPLCQI